MSGGADGKVMVCEPGNYFPIKTISLHTGDVMAVLDLKDGSALSSPDDKMLIRFNVVTREQVKS